MVDSWTTLDFICYVLFFIAFIFRISCIPGFFRVWQSMETRSGIQMFGIQVNYSVFWHVVDQYWENVWDTTDHNCPLFFDSEELATLRYGQYFYISSFILATIRTLELCTAR